MHFFAYNHEVKHCIHFVFTFIGVRTTDTSIAMEVEERFIIANMSAGESFGHGQKLISDETRLLFQWICNGVICQIIDIFGTVTNIINMICFIKQGFTDPVNITLFGMISF